MAKMKLADYLFQRIRDLGVDCTFGIPGDFILPLYAAQERFGLKTVVMTHEPSVGFAADGYARLKGLGVALVTYGAGGLNMINPIALAYAEESPLLVVSGAPETHLRSHKPELHHCVKTFDTQLKVMAEVTEAQACLDNPSIAQTEIDRVLSAVMGCSRPGYLEIPRDMVNAEIEVNSSPSSAIDQSPPALSKVADEMLTCLSKAVRPVLLSGVEIKRFGLTQELVSLAEQWNLPVVTSILGKGSFPESHPNFIGNYFGQFANPAVCEFVESADCVLALGTVLTEMETGGYSARFNEEGLIQANQHEIAIGDRHYPGINLSALVGKLLHLSQGRAIASSRASVPAIPPEEFLQAEPGDVLLVSTIISELRVLLDSDRFFIASDVGDCLYACMSLKADVFIAPGYYSSMGFGTPAGIGAQMADRSRRAIILVGDGGFQMTGIEISTAVKLGLNPIVIVFNNATYAMLKFIDQGRDYYNLPRWNYGLLAKAVGANGVRVTTGGELHQALIDAQSSSVPYLIDAVLSEEDISPTLRRLTDHFGKKVKAAIA